MPDTTRIGYGDESKGHNVSRAEAWFPCYVNDLLGSMRWKMMTPTQRGAYWQLICWQMQSDDGHLPADIGELSSLADMDISGEAKILDALPIDATGRRANPRALAEWQKRKAISGVRSSIGSKGIAKRWQTDTNCNSKPIPIATTSTSTSTCTDTDTPPPPKGGVLLPFASESFKAAWTAWKEHRRRLRKPMTDHAQRLTLAKLPKIEADAVAWINNAIERGWQGIFDPAGSTRKPAALINTHHAATLDETMQGRF